MDPTKLQYEEVKEQVRNVNQQPEGPGLRRDNESIDDFEHLEPESSPVKEFQGQNLPTKGNKYPSLGPEPVSEKESAASQQNKTDFSFMPENKNEQVGDGNFVSSSTAGSLIDSESFLSEESVIKPTKSPEKIAFPKEFQDVQPQFSEELVFQLSDGEKPQSKYETEPTTSLFDSKKTISQALMDTERREIISEGPNSHGDITDKFMSNIDFLKSEKKDDYDPDLDSTKPSKDILSTDHLISSVQDKDSFLDSDTVLEPSKSDFLKGKLTDDNSTGTSKSSLLPLDDGDNDNEDDADHEDSISSQEEKQEKLAGPVKKPVSKITEPEDVFLPNVSEPCKDLVSDMIPASDHNTVQDLPEENIEKLQFGVTDYDLDEIKPIQLFHNLGFDAWFKPDRLHPLVVELVYWRDPKKSGIVFGSVLGVLLSLSYFSLISVVAYLSLALLTGTISFRIYKNVLQAVQKTSDGHPFKDILELDLTLPQDKVREVTDIAVAHVNAAALELRRLFLVEDLVDSIKFGVLLWCLTYVGSWFNGMTLIIIAFVALFTLPKVYENNKAQIDQNLDVVRSKIGDITSKVKAAIPIGKKPAEEEKKDQ